MLRHAQGTVDEINTVSLFLKLTLLLVKMDFSITELWFGTVYFLFYLQLMSYLILNLYIKGCILVNFYCCVVISCFCCIMYVCCMFASCIVFIVYFFVALCIYVYIFVHVYCIGHCWKPVLTDVIYPLNSLNH